MRHSDLLKDKSEISSAYGVVIDEAVLNFRYDLTEIGIVAQFDNGSLSWDIIDACIGYSANNVQVILEIPFGSEYPEKNMVVEAMSADLYLSILPPTHAGVSDEDWDKYSDSLLRYTHEWLSQKNSRSVMYPVAGYLGYMVAEVFGYMPGSISDDPYIVNSFVDPIPVDIMDNIKFKLRNVIIESFGGEDGLKIYAHTLMSSLLHINSLSDS